MADELGEEGLMGELCNGFSMLMDMEKGVITFESLKRIQLFWGCLRWLEEAVGEDLKDLIRQILGFCCFHILGTLPIHG